MKLRVLLFAILFCITAMMPVFSAEKAEKAEWTVLVYLAADNNLCEAGYQNIYEMAKIGSTKDVNIVCLFDDEGTDKSYFVKVNASEMAKKKSFKEWNLFEDKAVKAKAIGEVNTGSPDVLYSFVNKAADLFPAERYFLLFWNHGSGFYTVGDAAAAEQGSFDESEATDKTRDFHVESRKFSKERINFLEQLKDLDSIAYDDNSGGDSLSQLELKAVLNQLKTDKGMTFDIIGFDACLMNNIEVVTQLSPFSKMVIGSEESEPGAGWDYEGFLTPMIENPKIALADLSEALCKTYVKKSTKGLMNKIRFLMSPMPVTLAATDTVQVADVEKAVDDLAKALISYMRSNPEEAVKEITKAQAKSLKFSYKFYVDLPDLCEKLKKYCNDGAVRAAAKKVYKSINGGMFSKGAVVNNETSGTKQANGLTIFFPSFDVPPTALRLYTLLDFAKKTKWDEMIATLMKRLPSVKIGKVVVAKDHLINTTKTEIEITPSGRFRNEYDVEVELAQYEGSFLMRLMQKFQIKKIKFKKNPVNATLHKGVITSARFDIKSNPKIEAWLKEHNTELGQMTMKLTVRLKNGYVLAEIPCRYSTLLGIDVVLTADYASKFFGQVFEQLDKMALDPKDENYASTMQSIFKQIFKPVFELLFPNSKPEVKGLANFATFLKSSSTDSNPVHKSLYNAFGNTILKVLEQLKTSGAEGTETEEFETVINLYRAL